MSDSKPLLQQAIDSLSISDVYLAASRAEHAESFYPKARDAFDGLKVQTMHIARRSEIVETDQSDQYLLRIMLGFGVRWVDEETEDAEEPLVRALIEADYVAEYVMSDLLAQEAVDAFALQNASYHVWPYWREYLASQCERLRMPKVMLPIRQFPANCEQ